MSSRRQECSGSRGGDGAPFQNVSMMQAQAPIPVVFLDPLSFPRSAHSSCRLPPPPNVLCASPQSTSSSVMGQVTATGRSDAATFFSNSLISNKMMHRMAAGAAMHKGSPKNSVSNVGLPQFDDHGINTPNKINMINIKNDPGKLTSTAIPVVLLPAHGSAHGRSITGFSPNSTTHKTVSGAVSPSSVDSLGKLQIPSLPSSAVALLPQRQPIPAASTATTTPLDPVGGCPIDVDTINQFPAKTIHPRLKNKLLFVPFPSDETLHRLRLQAELPDPVEFRKLAHTKYVKAILGQLPTAAELTPEKIAWIFHVFGRCDVHISVPRRAEGALKQLKTNFRVVFVDSSTTLPIIDKKLYIDRGGVWYARNDAEQAALQQYLKSDKCPRSTPRVGVTLQALDGHGGRSHAQEVMSFPVESAVRHVYPTNRQRPTATTPQ